MDIPDIRIDIREIGIRDIPTWLKEPPEAIPPSVPVTQTIGVPVVNIPGCVEAHEANNKSNKEQDIKKAIWYLRMSIGDDPRE